MAFDGGNAALDLDTRITVAIGVVAVIAVAVAVGIAIAVIAAILARGAGEHGNAADNQCTGDYIARADTVAVACLRRGCAGQRPGQSHGADGCGCDTTLRNILEHPDRKSVV